MKVSDLLKDNNFKLLTAADTADNDFEGAYCGDLLSWVMGNGKQGSIWLTVLTHMNIIAVASLREFKAVCICEGSKIIPEVLNKANEEKIAVIETNLPIFEVTKILVEKGL